MEITHKLLRDERGRLYREPVVKGNFTVITHGDGDDACLTKAVQHACKGNVWSAYVDDKGTFVIDMQPKSQLELDVEAEIARTGDHRLAIAHMDRIWSGR